MDVVWWLLIIVAIVGSSVLTFVSGFVGEGLFDPSKDRRLVERGIALAILGPLAVLTLLGLAMASGWLGWPTVGLGLLSLAVLTALGFVGTAAYLGILKARVAARDDELS